MARFVSGCTLLVALAACEGSLVAPVSPTGEDPGPGPGPSPGGGTPSLPDSPPPTQGGVDVDVEGSACTPVASEAPLQRLSVREYEAALRATVGDATVSEVENLIAALPIDAPEDETDFARQDQRLSDRHVDGTFAIAEAIAASVADDAERRGAVFGPCAATDPTPVCLEQVAPAFLERTLRRPVDAAEVAERLTEALTFAGAESFEALLFLALMSPDFLYRFETRGFASPDQDLLLDDYELASRLSFHFWGTPPDAELLAAARDGSLSTDAGYEAQVDRLFEDPRTEATLMDFFVEWLHLDRGGFADSPRLDELRDGLETNGLAPAMRAEIEALVQHHLRSDTARWTDVFTTRESFATHPTLAALYGVEPWDGESERPVLPTEERSGLLTRAGMLYTADGSTNPFRRGVFVRRALLCDPVLPPPTSLPPDALNTPEPVAGVSTRAAFEALVVDEPCASCHLLFSDIGYALEAYDGLGRYRDEERLVAADGTTEGTAAVDSQVTPFIDFTDPRPVAGPVELSQRVAESPKANRCLAQRYLQFTLRRDILSPDACAVERVSTRLEQGEPLRDVLRAVALEPAFRRRTVEN
jgi:hypothetical protein